MLKLSVFQLILLAVFAALAVSGVLIFALVVNTNSSQTMGPVTIWGTLDQAAVKSVISQVANGDESFKQVTYVQKNADTYIDDLTEALAIGRGPDLFILRQDQAVSEANKVYPTPYEQFSSDQFRDAFVEAADPFLGQLGVLAIPFVANPLVLYWNRDMFASAGYANPPRYWDEISAMSQKITKKNDSGQILKSTVSFGEFRNVTHAKDIISLLILQAGNPIVSGGSVTLATDRQGAESALRFYTEFADPSKAIYSWNRALPESRDAFIAGDLALYVGYANEEGDIVRMNPNLNFGATSTPQIRSAERPVDFARVYAFATTRTSKNLLGALTTASRLSSADTSAAFARALGMSSARRDVLGASRNSLSSRQAILSRSWADPDPEESDEVFRAMVENVTSGALRLNESISRAQQQLNQLF